MKYIVILLLLSFFAVAGCLDASPYEKTSPSALKEDPGVFEGKQVCIDGVIEENAISGIRIEQADHPEERYEKKGVLSTVCGNYSRGLIRADTIEPILSVSTDKDVYRSNETMNVHVDYVSRKEGNVRIEVSGIQNAFGRAMVSESRDVSIQKGSNGFDFVFTTPLCEECSALEPGEYPIHAVLTRGSETFRTYRNITLEGEDSTSSGNRSVEGEVNDTAPEDTGPVSAVSVEYFYDAACQKCARASPVIDEVVSSYGDRVAYSKRNVFTDEGLERARKYRLPGVPSVVINEEVLISYEDYGGDTEKLRSLLKGAIDGSFASTAGVSKGNHIILSVPSVFVVGFLAGFNPCLLAILAFIASVTLATTGKRRSVFLIVLMFSLGIFVTYLIVGIGLLRIIEQSAPLQSMITNIIILLISLLGLWHVYDAYHLRKNTESSFYTPKAFIRLTERVTKKVSLPAAFFIGALFSLIKAPCVGAVYFVILDLVRSGEVSGILYLGAYNLGVVLPVLIVGGGIAFGLNPEKVEAFRKEKRSAMRLITGLTLIIIAVLMYIGVI